MQHGQIDAVTAAGFADDPRDTLIEAALPTDTVLIASPIRHVAEALLVTRSGAIMVLGWVDDVTRPLESVTLNALGWRLTFDAASLVRHLRPAVAETIGRSDAYPLGYLGFIFGEREIRPMGVCDILFRFHDGGVLIQTMDIKVVEDTELRGSLLTHLLLADGPDAPAVNPIASLGRGMGDHILRFNRSITASLIRAPYVERLGARGAPRCSIVVCLDDRPEAHFLQNALFSANPGIEAYEFIFVCHTPSLFDRLLENARKSNLVDGLCQTIVLLTGDPGLGAANNTGVRFAVGGRLVFLGPNVLPGDQAWAQKHLNLIDLRPSFQTLIFGAALNPEDGSQANGDLHFEMDTKVSVDRHQVEHAQLLRVRPFGQGAPVDFDGFPRPRPVAGVSGDFISVDRSWFEQLGGFTQDQIFSGYEDADLCLRSLRAGVAPWIQDLRFWCVEPARPEESAARKGATLVNRWSFSSRWGEMAQDGLLGPNPTHPLLRASEP